MLSFLNPFRPLESKYRDDFFCSLEIEPKDKAQYAYDVFDGCRAIDFEKTFGWRGEASPELAEAIEAIPQKGLKLPVFLGKTEEGELKWIDLLDMHTLVTGVTGFGKTNWLNQLIISLIHFSNPEYLKILILDGKKGGGFKGLEKVVTLARETNEIADAIFHVEREMDRRLDLFKSDTKTHINSALETNEMAYRMRQKNKIMPYIVVIFDEFADFILLNRRSGADKKKKRQEGGEEGTTAVEDTVQRLVSMGRSPGINLVFATQHPYKKVIEGLIKANFARRNTFRLLSSIHERMIFDGIANGEIRALELYRGEFLTNNYGGQLKMTSILSSEKTLWAASRNWVENKLDFRLARPKH